MRYTFAFYLIVFSFSVAGQFKNDNVSFKTVYLEDLCKTLQNNSDFILLDVRSKGEHNDTSSSANLNIGHLHNAINIDIREFPARLNELAAYRDKPIFVYCSQSQRSRRASKILADSGYAKVFNINGGLTSLHLFGNDVSDCSQVVMEMNVPYKLISPQQLSSKLQEKKTYYIVDVRKDSIYNGTTNTEREKAQGRFETAVNIPFAKLAGSFPSIAKDQPILVVDEFGSESPKAAQLLMEKGYKDISVLFNGMEAWVQFQLNEEKKQPLKWDSPVKYNLLTAERFDQLMRQQKSVVVLDVRTKEEFNNQSKDYWRNVGNIKDAKNIPYADLHEQISSLSISKNTPVVIYAFSSNNDIFEAARILNDKGYTNVNVLLGGLFNLRWKAANLKGRSQLRDWAVNIPVENQ